MFNPAQHRAAIAGNSPGLSIEIMICVIWWAKVFSVLGYIDVFVVYYFKLGHVCSKQSPKYRPTIKLFSSLYIVYV